jgi:putative aldouronate transport system permease protein
MFTMFFSFGLIPYFILICNIRLYNTFWVYIIPSLYSVWNMIIIQSFIRELPIALIEAAKIDGYGEYTILFRIVIPLSGPVLAAIALFTVVGHWNSYFDSMMYTSSPTLQTIQYYLKKVITDPAMSSGMGRHAAQQLPESAMRITPQTIKLAAIAVTAVPVMLIYPFMQKHFAKGMMIGSVKG